MSGMSFDVGDLTKFADDLVGSADGLLNKVKPVVAKGALEVKKAMRADMQASKHFKQVAHTITYDTKDGRGWVEAEVGPVTSGKTVGDLAHLAYFGGVHGGGNTVRDPQAALDDEKDPFYENLSAVIGDLL